MSAGKSGYEEGRRLYTEELNAAVRGAFAGGASEVVAMDCHGAGGDWSFNSLIPEALDPRCEFVVQTRWTEYTEMLEQGCDVALFVGQHARAGAERGVLSHTVSSTKWRNLRFNGTLVGEVAINAALCGTWGMPGRARHRRRRRLRGGERPARRRAFTRSPSRPGLGRFSARHLSPARARERARGRRPRGARERASAPVYDPGAPCTIEVELATPDHADPYRHRAGVDPHRSAHGRRPPRTRGGTPGAPSTC